MKENGDIFVPSEDQKAIAYKLASWYQHEFIPANSQMCYPDGKTTGKRAMYVCFLTPQGTGHGLGLLTIGVWEVEADSCLYAVKLVDSITSSQDCF